MADILGNTGKFDAFKSNALTKSVQNGGVQFNNPFQTIPPAPPAADIPKLNKELTVGDKFLKPKPRDPIEAIITVFVRITSFIKTNTYTILWGAPTNPPPRAVIKNPQTGFYETVKGSVQQTAQKISNFFQSGLFNILDVINSLDLCGIINYLTDPTNSRGRKRPPKPWTPDQIALFYVQDQAKYVQKLIDKYTALPTTLVRQYSTLEPKAETQQQAISGSGAPAGKDQIAGTDVQKFNLYNLIQEIKAAFTVGGPNAIFTAQDATIISQVPGLGANLNFIDDFVQFANRYTDYRNIDNEDLRKLLQKINEVRSVCVTIQNLNFKGLVFLVDELLGGDLRKDIQKLSKFIDPTKLLPALKQISQQINAFVKMAQKMYNIISQVQFIIKILIILAKVLKFLVKFFLVNILPAVFATLGIIATLEKAREDAEKFIEKIIKRLEQINGLMAVVLSLVRYILANAIELLVRLETLIAKLEACEAMQDSPILADLKASYDDLKQIKEQLEAYIANYDGKTNPDSAQFGEYSIRVVDEELTDPTIPNKRRRGIALNRKGVLVAQSDLTFATNTSIIIQEVKVKLVSQGLIAPQFNVLSEQDLSTVFTSVQYLDNDDVLSESFDFNTLLQDLAEGSDSPDNLDENEGIGLNAFINNLKGGKRLRKRVRAQMALNSRKLADNIKSVEPEGTLTGGLASKQLTEANQLETQNIKDDIDTWKEEIREASTQGPAGYPIIADRTKKIKEAERKLNEAQARK
jgi:hypothetical protein